MSELRLANAVGPVVVLYLLADAASRNGRLDAAQVLVGLIALIVSFGPRLVADRIAAGERGARRVGFVGTALGITMAARLGYGVPSTTSVVLTSIAAPLLGALVVDLACHVPDAPKELRIIRPVLFVTSLLAASAGLVSALAPNGFGIFAATGRKGLSLVPWLWCESAFLLATLFRALRVRLGSSPSALAANAWALLGLVPSTLVGGLVLCIIVLGLHPAHLRGDWVALTVIAGTTLYCHIALVEPARRIEAASAFRRAIEWVVSGLVIAVSAAALAIYFPRDPIAAALLAAFLLAVATLVRHVARPVLRRLLAPYAGKLLDAIDEAIADVDSATTLESFAAATLMPFRRASAEPDAEPRLFVTDPSWVYHLDAAGVAHARRELASEMLIKHFADGVSAPLTFLELDAQVVRRPELRPMHEQFEALSALVVVPIVIEAQLEGVLVVPRGRRATAPSLEELVGLERFARVVAPRLSLLAATQRAVDRVARLIHERDRAEERAESLEDEVLRLRTEVRALRQGRGAAGKAVTVVAYSAAARDLESAISEVAPTMQPVALVAEPGMHVDRVASRIHAASGVAEGPFVLADCTAIAEEDGAGAFFGVEGDASAPGFLRLADGGTLVLADVVALAPGLQRALADALATRGARAVGSHAIYGFDVRVLVVCRLPVEILVERGTLDVELARRIGMTELRVPPLRERLDDIPSLALLAVARAARRLGRAPLGFEQDALERLLDHPWPGNVRELELVIELAVEATPGDMISGDTVAAMLAVGLPIAPPVEPEPAKELDGSLVEIEKRALLRALDQAGGNKSLAARSLGLKRKNFIDKLRRFGLDEPSSGGGPS